MTTPKIFITYRRKDSEQYVFSLGLLLEDRFPGHVFWDRDAIKSGEKYKVSIEDALRESGVVIVVIGEAWLDIRDEQGRRRLDDPKDVLRTELLTAIQLKVPLIPVLVGSASMPSAKDLPHDLLPLIDWHAMRLNLDDPKGSMARLMGDVQRLLEERRAENERKEQLRLEEQRRTEEEHRRQEQLAAERVAEEERQRQAAEQTRLEQGRKQAAEQARLEQLRRPPERPPEEKPPSELKRVIGTFIAPSRTFTDLRRSANWLVPWLLLAIASIALVVVVDKKLGMGKVVENQLAMQPKQAAQLDKLSPEDRAARMQTVVKFNRAIAYAYPVVIVIVLAIIAAVLLASFNFGFGAELTFNQCLAVCMYASLPGILKVLIAILAIAVGGGEAFTFQNPVASNLSGLVDPSSHFLYSVATSFDIFTIWTLALTGIGFSCLTKVKRGTCLGVVFGWWAIFVIGGAALAAAFA